MTIEEQAITKGEVITHRAKISKSAIIVFWLSIPILLLLILLTAILPQIITVTTNTAIRDAIMAELGIEDLSIIQAFTYSLNSLAKVALGFVCFLICLLVLVWLVFCIITTIKLNNYQLIITDKCVYGKANKTSYCIPHNEIKDVFIEQSIWGKLFNYGTVTVYGKGQSTVAIRNIYDAITYKKLLYNLSSIEQNCY